MSKRPYQLAQNQAKVKVVAQAYDNNLVNNAWLAPLAMAFMAVAYFFGFFFAFPEAARAGRRL